MKANEKWTNGVATLILINCRVIVPSKSLPTLFTRRIYRRQGRQGLEHVHRSAAFLVHARRRPRAEDRRRGAAGLDGGRAPRPGHHPHPALLRQRPAPGRDRVPRPLRRVLPGGELEPRGHRHLAHGVGRAPTLVGVARGVHDGHDPELGVPDRPEEGPFAGGLPASLLLLPPVLEREILEQGVVQQRPAREDRGGMPGRGIQQLTDASTPPPQLSLN